MPSKPENRRCGLRSSSQKQFEEGSASFKCRSKREPRIANRKGAGSWCPHAGGTSGRKPSIGEEAAKSLPEVHTTRIGGGGVGATLPRGKKAAGQIAAKTRGFSDPWKTEKEEVFIYRNKKECRAFWMQGRASALEKGGQTKNPTNARKVGGGWRFSASGDRKKHPFTSQPNLQKRRIDCCPATGGKNPSSSFVRGKGKEFLDTLPAKGIAGRFQSIGVDSQSSGERQRQSVITRAAGGGGQRAADSGSCCPKKEGLGHREVNST